MSKGLVIVESPAKAKTIKKYLGTGFEVLASYGHVRDLLPKEGAVDTSHDFSMRYELIEKNAKHVAAIVKSARPSATGADIFTAFTTTALDIRAVGIDRDSGYGLIMAPAAVNAILH